MAVLTSVESRLKARKARRAANKEDSERKLLFKALKREADGYGSIIIKVAFNRGFRQVLRGILAPGMFDILAGNRPIRHLKFTHVLLDEYRLYFRIDARDLPGISLADLRHEDFIYDLSRAVGKDVKYEGTPRSGDFIIIERDSGISGIPPYLTMQKAFGWIPENADPLAYCMGQAANNKPLIVSLEPLPHLLVAGTTRSGKSVNLNNIICTFAIRNSPDILQMALIDLKNGVEFARYQGIPHLMPTANTHIPGIALNEAEAKIIFQALIKEIDVRGKKFGKAGVVNLNEYHHAKPDDPIPLLVLFIDELSVLLFNEDKEIRQLGKFLMSKVLATGAAYGIHVVACTQDPTREIVPRHLRANLPARTCFRTTSIASSVAMLENKHAYGLKPKGRGIFQFEEEIEFQGPYLSTKIVKHHVQRVIAKWSTKQLGDQKVSAGLHDLLIYAIEQRGGSLAWEPLAEVFAPTGLSAEKIKGLIKGAHNREYALDGNIYQVQRNLGRNGTRLVLVRPVDAVTAPEADNRLAAD